MTHEQVHGMSHEQASDHLSEIIIIIFLSPRDRGKKALQMQESAEAMHRQKKDHSCYVHYIKSPLSHTNVSFLLPQDAPHTFKLFPFSL